MDSCADLTISDSTAYCAGQWTAPNIHKVESTLSAWDWPATSVQFDLSEVDALDTSGAWLLQRTIDELRAAGKQVSSQGANERVRRLLAMVAAERTAASNPRKPYSTL